MKTLFKSGVMFICFLATIQCASAQSAARSSKDVTPRDTNNTAIAPVETQVDTSHYRSSRGIPMPSYVDDLFRDGKTTEALAEFEKFKSSLKKIESFELLFLEYTAYKQAAMSDWNNPEYPAKMNEFRQTIISQYPNRSESFLLQIEDDMPAEKKVELATKAIEADPSNEMAYRERGLALMSLEQTKKACEDLEKVSYKRQMPEYWQCRHLK